MEASPANDRATVEPLLETTAMELNGGPVPDDLPAADADRREDSDLSASALQKIYDIVTRQVSLAMNSMNRRAPGPVPVNPTEAATTATATTASASQAQTVCVPQTQCSPVTSAFVPLSAGGYSLPSTSSTPWTPTSQHHSGLPFFPPVCHGLPMPTLSLPIRGCMGLSLTFGHPRTNPVSQQRATSMSV